VDRTEGEGAAMQGWSGALSVNARGGGRRTRRGGSVRRVGRFQERFRLTRKSKIVKSNFFESFDVFSGLLCLFLSLLSFPGRSDFYRPTSIDIYLSLSLSLALFLPSFPSSHIILPDVSALLPRVHFLYPFYTPSRATVDSSPVDIRRPTYAIRLHI